MRAIDMLEAAVQRDTGRNIGGLTEHARGGLRAAAQSIAMADRPCVGILTGFYVVGGHPPGAETDGPPGAVLLAAMLRDAGIPAFVVTDEYCAPVVQRTGAVAGIPVRIVSGTKRSVADLAADLERTGTTHVVAVERLGPAADGETYNMRGEPMSTYVAPLWELFEHGPWTRIAVGDGGNEIGMGNVPSGVVAASIDNGALIHCVVSCDALIVAGVSNWGAIALGVAVSMLRDARSAAGALVERHDALLQAAVDAGAVDGTTGRPTLSVDGLDLAANAPILMEMQEQIRRVDNPAAA